MGACGSDDDDADVGRAAGEFVGPAVAKPRYPYPPDVVANFVRACAETSGGQRAVCRCTANRLQHTVPYEQFAAADRAAREDRPIPRAVSRDVEAATSACRDSR